MWLRFFGGENGPRKQMENQEGAQSIQGRNLVMGKNDDAANKLKRVGVDRAFLDAVASKAKEPGTTDKPDDGDALDMSVFDGRTLDGLEDYLLRIREKSMRPERNGNGASPTSN